jgi:hypothetical protein
VPATVRDSPDSGTARPAAVLRGAAGQEQYYHPGDFRMGDFRLSIEGDAMTGFGRFWPV